MQQTFNPPRRAGMFFHATTMLLLVVFGAFSLMRATKTTMGITLLVYLIALTAATILLPLFIYRTYSLFRGAYTLTPDGLQIRWGIRMEAIPMEKIQWVNRASDFPTALPLPWIRWPGSIVGMRTLDTEKTIEFMASSGKGLILIATTRRVFAISPTDAEGFLNAFQYFAEAGSLNPMVAQSVYPAVLLRGVWANPRTRWILLSGLALNSVLLLWIGLVLFGQTAQPLNMGQGVARFIVLPILSAFFFLVNSLFGLFFFRRPRTQPLAYLLWFSSILSPLLFFAAVQFSF